MRKIALVAILIFITSADLIACSCGEFPSPEQAEANATVVFEGTVVSKWPVLLRLPWPVEGKFTPVARWTFDVSRSWKGGSGEITVLQLPHNCSDIFALGKRYVVFAYDHEMVEGALASHKCGGPNFDEEAITAALGLPEHSYPEQFELESDLRRSVRHWYTYGLTGVAAVLSLPLGDPWLRGIPVTVIKVAATLAVFLGAFYFVRGRRSPLLGYLALGLTLVALIMVFVVGFHYSHDPWLAHLVEHYCPGCESG